jgi:hypothetical protein
MKNPLLAGAIAAGLVSVGAAYEVVMLLLAPWLTITELTRRHPHRMLIGIGGGALILGFMLGGG